MELNLNSFSAKLYKWFYAIETNKYWTIEAQMPKTLCSYYWELVVAYILAIPLAVLIVPTYLFEQYKGDKSHERIGAGFVLWSVVFIFFTLIYPLFEYFSILPIIGNLFEASCILWSIIIIIAMAIGCGIFWDYLADRIENNRTYYEKKPNLLIEYIKAKKNKYCPKITWIKNN